MEAPRGPFLVEECVGIVGTYLRVHDSKTGIGLVGRKPNETQEAAHDGEAMNAAWREGWRAGYEAALEEIKKGVGDARKLD